MEGYLISFVRETPFYNKDIFIVADSTGQLKDKLQEQFTSEVITTLYDDPDSTEDGELQVGVGNTYTFHLTKINTVIK